MFVLGVLSCLAVALAQEPAPLTVDGSELSFGMSRASVEATLAGLAPSESPAPEGIDRLCTSDGSLCVELFEDALVALRVRCADLGCPDKLDLWATLQTRALRTMTQVWKGRAPYGPADSWSLGTQRAEFAEITLANSGLPPAFEATFTDLEALRPVVAAHPGYLAALRVGASEPMGVAARKDSDPNKPVVMGALGIPEVDATFAADRAGAETCYAKRVAKEPGVSGTTMVKLTVEADGSVSATEGAPGTLDDKKIAKCLAKRASALTFPPLRGGEQALVTYTFTFGS